MMAKTQEFLQQKVPTYLAKLTSNVAPQWGMMTAQHMVEHVQLVFKVSVGKIPMELAIPPTYLPKQMAFLRSERSFKKNLKAPGLPKDKLLPLQYENLETAKQKLLQSIKEFYTHFDGTGKRSIHPAFGNLNKEEWEQFHYKHFQHHFAQFGLLN